MFIGALLSILVNAAGKFSTENAPLMLTNSRFFVAFQFQQIHRQLVKQFRHLQHQEQILKVVLQDIAILSEVAVQLQVQV